MKGLSNLVRPSSSSLSDLSLGMKSSLTEHPQQKRPLLVGFKGRGDDHVGSRCESEEAKD